MLNKISDLQHSILQSALEREDRLLPLPSNLKGAAAKRIAERLVHAGWAKEVKAQKDASVWRRDAAAGREFALKLTAAGMKAISAASDERGGMTTAAPEITVAQEAVVERAAARRRATRSVEAQASAGEDPFAGRQKNDSSAVAREPRSGSKLDSMLGLLRSESGATLAELVSATGWLPHSARAALTGLRKRSYALTLARGERGDASIYRVIAPVGEAKR